MPCFLHTADWQLGMAFPGHGEAGAWLAEARFRTVERLVRLARERQVDFVLVAGDVLDGPHLPGERIRQLCRTIERLAPVPVFLLPGNHDPLVPGGVWERPEWESAPANLRICGDEPIVLEAAGAVLYPCPLRAAHGAGDPTGSIPERPAAEHAGLVRIGLAHGSLPAGGPVNHPIDPARPALAALDYLALGDWHSVHLERENGERIRAAYPGTPEPTRFGERDSGKVLLVRIDGPGAPPAVEPLAVACADWRSVEARIESAADVEELASRLQRIEQPERVVLELRLAGAPALEATSRLDAIERALAGRFRHLRLLRDGLLLRPDPGEIALLAGEGPLGRAVRAIAAELEQSPGEQRAVAEQALRIYHELAHE